MKTNFLLLLVTIICGLLTMEFVLRLVSPPAKIGVGTSQTEKAKIYGWTLSPNSRETFINPDTGEKSYFFTNSQGWKDVEHRFKKPKDVTRLLFLGDSGTYGVVGLNDLYTRQVEILLKKLGFYNVEVISMGVGGWGTDQELEALYREGLRYEPDFVIYQFSGNDVTDNLYPIETTASREVHWKKVFKYKLKNGTLEKIKLCPKAESLSMGDKIRKFLLKSVLIYKLNKLKNIILEYLSKSGLLANPAYEAMKKNHWWDKYPIDPLNTYYKYGSIDESKTLSEGWSLMEALIVKMEEVCQSNSAGFLIFSADGENGNRVWNIKMKLIQTDGVSDFVIFHGKKYLVDMKAPLKKLKEICKKNNIPLIEPKREYERYDYDPHPNRKGNLSMAQDIVDFLISWEPFLKKMNKSGVLITSDFQ